MTLSNAPSFDSSHKQSPQTAAVVGGGIAGLSAAWGLIQRGISVTLFEASKGGSPKGASWAAGGMLTPNTEVNACPIVLGAGREALKAWPDFIAHLNQHLTTPVQLHRGGCVVVAHQQDHGSYLAFEQKAAYLNREGSPATFSTLNRAQLSDKNSVLGQRFNGGLWFDQEAWIHPESLTSGLRQALLSAGCTMMQGIRVQTLAANKITFGASNKAALSAEMGFDLVVDCRGTGAKTDLPTVRGVRGETIEVYAPEVILNHLVRLIHPRYSIYVIPRKGQRFLIGATEIESEDDGPITLRSAMELLSAAYSLHSGFAEARLLDMRSQCRPALSNNAPMIDWHDGILTVNGLYRHGILLTPWVMQTVMSKVAEHSTPPPSSSTFQTSLNRSSAERFTTPVEA
ncbi:glycine oxidase ThiO [Marinibactrum halimedae]|uniref:Thiamine biosynthesis oxidoreductase ThiO n=1 Tax=Marinibactrum halimedae TaxID=1444977 RepID=A0AA37T571_9GAMM|nr:glycine oxidase ThiO [Marinibactrum halimedae]MCD9458690.1 glycine oxidase ThiO [Marinibactrum halimedae]GLS25944.1 thiamine biosynthesis oxidoreductase ThiO [Marinibactrum halimedae]